MRRFLRRHGMILFGGVGLLVGVGAFTYSLFVRSSSALEFQLRETLRAAAVAAAASIDGDALAGIRGPEDMQSPAYRTLATTLRSIVDQIPQARFAYVLRRTETPGVLEFVVDADAVAPPWILDRDGDGTLDPDEEPSFPGERYDAREYPALMHDAFVRSTTDPEITVDQWGELLSGYAPIRSRSTGETVAVLGIDMDARVFRAYASSVLSPFAAVLIVTLAGLLTAGVALLAESRQLQVLSRVNAERSGLLQLTFHQLGEPITILQWGIETLEDAKDDPPTLGKILPENLADMREGVRRLGSIIDTLQEAEKVELDSFENKPVRQPVRALLKDAIELVAPAGAEGTPPVELDADDITAPVDPHLLTIVLRRLVENAIEFTPKDRLPVRVRARGEGKWLRIDVVDRGCGIPERDVPRLFEKYRRASNASTMKPDGNGLGLYIARGLAERMGGTVGVVSREGEGTTFTVRLPMHPAERI